LAPSAFWKGGEQDAVARVEIDDELDHLYRKHGERLWRAVFAFCGDREVASDAVSEAPSASVAAHRYTVPAGGSGARPFASRPGS
jgi:DNA-directed RNA polymerase specialized sigma24 family protein